jgi:hypothetical protein
MSILIFPPSYVTDKHIGGLEGYSRNVGRSDGQSLNELIRGLLLLRLVIIREFTIVIGEASNNQHYY